VTVLICIVVGTSQTLYRRLNCKQKHTTRS